MTTLPIQTLQEFFDQPAAMAASHKLSPSASEPLSVAELADLAPDTMERVAAGVLDYPPRYGPPEQVAMIAARYRSVPVEGVQITSGLDEALGLILTALVEPGQRVIVQTPCYPPQREVPAWRGVEVVPWALRDTGAGWDADLDELRDLLREPAALVVATFPNNPTGFMPDESFLKDLVAVLEENGTPLISDEIYGGLPVDGPGAPQMADRYTHAISLHGLSKTCGLPGLRYGWMATRDLALMTTLKELKNLMNCYVPGPVAALADVALKNEAPLVARNDAIRTLCLDAADAFFARHANLFDWHAPRAGVVAFPRWLGPGGTRELSERLLTAGISLAPSTCFQAGDSHARFGLTRRTFPDALAALDQFLTNTL